MQVEEAPSGLCCIRSRSGSRQQSLYSFKSSAERKRRAKRGSLLSAEHGPLFVLVSKIWLRGLIRLPCLLSNSQRLRLWISITGKLTLIVLPKRLQLTSCFSLLQVSSHPRLARCEEGLRQGTLHGRSKARTVRERRRGSSFPQGHRRGPQVYVHRVSATSPSLS